jgi:hypothetical protein
MSNKIQYSEMPKMIAERMFVLSYTCASSSVLSLFLPMYDVRLWPMAMHEPEGISPSNCGNKPLMFLKLTDGSRQTSHASNTGTNVENVMNIDLHEQIKI